MAGTRSKTREAGTQTYSAKGEGEGEDHRDVAKGLNGKMDHLLDQCRRHLAALNDLSRRTCSGTSTPNEHSQMSQRTSQGNGDCNQSTLTIVGAVPYSSHSGHGMLLRPEDLVSDTEAETSVFHAGLPPGLWDSRSPSSSSSS